MEHNPSSNSNQSQALPNIHQMDCLQEGRLLVCCYSLWYLVCAELCPCCACVWLQGGQHTIEVGFGGRGCGKNTTCTAYVAQGESK